MSAVAATCATCVVAALLATLAACGSDDTVVDLDGPDATTGDAGESVDAAVDGADAMDDGDAAVGTLDGHVPDDGAADDAGDAGDAAPGSDGGLPDADASPPDASPCQDGQTLCGSVCTNLQTDETSCGGCGHACDAGTACTAGSCEVTCGSGLTACDGGCAALDEDPENCGACGEVCSAFAHETAVCAAKTCAEVCVTGYADCDLEVADGCEAHLTADPKNCGVCAHVCPAKDVCTAGKCVHK